MRDLQRHAQISLQSRHVAAKELTGDAPCLKPPSDSTQTRFSSPDGGGLVNPVSLASSSVVFCVSSSFNTGPNGISCHHGIASISRARVSPTPEPVVMIR
jgi:hypothetical protein